MTAEAWSRIYCGPAPDPSEIWLRWNLDPVLLLALAALAVALRASRPGLLAVAALAVAFVSPLCALSAALFSARVAHHVLLVAVAAPLLALAWPARMPTPCTPLDLTVIGRLDFAAPDEVRFPATALCRAAIAEGGGRPAQLNAANEIAVAAFLAGRIGFTAIVDTVRAVMDAEAPPVPATLHDIFSIDAASRAAATQRVESLEHV